MILLVLHAILLPTFTVSMLVQTSIRVDNVTLTTRTDKGVALSMVLLREFGAGRRAPITVVLRNCGPTNFYYEETTPHCDFTLTVKSETGALIPYTKKGHDEIEPGPVHYTIDVKMPVGFILQRSYDLTKWFNLSKPGTYTVSATRMIGTPQPESVDAFELSTVDVSFKIK